MLNSTHAFYLEFLRSLNLSWREGCSISPYPGPAVRPRTETQTERGQGKGGGVQRQMGVSFSQLHLKIVSEVPTRALRGRTCITVSLTGMERRSWGGPDRLCWVSSGPPDLRLRPGT